MSGDICDFATLMINVKFNIHTQTIVQASNRSILSMIDDPFVVT